MDDVFIHMMNGLASNQDIWLPDSLFCHLPHHLTLDKSHGLFLKKWTEYFLKNLTALKAYEFFH